MIKLYIFESVHDARAFNSPEETTPGHDAAEKVAAPPSTDSEEDITPAKRKYKKRIVIQRCEGCGRVGHEMLDCPNQRDDEEARIGSKLSPEELHAAVQGLKEDGLDSVRIAQRLKVTLKTVNENW